MLNTVEVIEGNAIDRYRAKFAVEKSLPDLLIEKFGPSFDAAIKVLEESAGLTVTDATQVTEIKQAKAFRLALKAIRVDADKLRKELKEDALRTGNSIQAVYNALEVKVAAEEARLKEAEEFAERAEAERIRKTVEERTYRLRELGAEPAHYVLAAMKADEFDALCEQLKAAEQKRRDDAAKAEADRIAAEQARAEEAARVKAENERLRAERAAADKARFEAEAAARKEREEAARLQAAAKAKADEEIAAARADAAAKQREIDARAAADAKAKREEAEKARKIAELARKAEAAPDREKIHAYLTALSNVPAPTLTTADAKEILSNIKIQLNELLGASAKYVQNKL